MFMQRRAARRDRRFGLRSAEFSRALSTFLYDVKHLFLRMARASFGSLCPAHFPVGESEREDTAGVI